MKYRIRFNKEYLKSNPIKHWRIIDEHDQMVLVNDIQITVPSYTESRVEYDYQKEVWETKWNIVCDGDMILDEDRAKIV